MSTLVIITPAMWVDARRVAALEHHQGYSSDPMRVLHGLLAERAVVDFLLRQEDRAVQWLSAEPTPDHIRRLPRHARPHPADIAWGTYEIDVKLTKRNAGQLAVKAGAQHLTHLYVEWGQFQRSIRILGILPPNMPETLEPSVPLVDGTQTYTNVRTGAVHGWWVPRARLLSISYLLEVA
jgi:hypothetical protein